jgi:Spy/CpxP family protein refolding chaperone
MNTLSTGRIVAYFFAVFLAGGVTGNFIGMRIAKQTALKPPQMEDMSTRMCRRLQTRLGLTADQMENIKPIIDKSSQKIGAVHRDCMHRIADMVKQSYAEISAQLTPEQQQRLQELEQERSEWERKNKEKRSKSGSSGNKTPPPETNAQP